MAIMYKSPFEKLHETALPSRTALHKLLIQQAIIRTCLNCDHYVSDKLSARCGLFNALPPPEVIVFGCEKWEEKIPF